MAFCDDRVSVRHRVCWDTLFSGRLTRLTRLRAAVNQGSTLAFRTTLGEDRGAKAAAEDGSNTVGMMMMILCAAKDVYDIRRLCFCFFFRRDIRLWKRQEEKG